MEGNVSKADQAKTELSPLSAASGNSHTRRECIIEAAGSRVQEADGRWQMAETPAFIVCYLDTCM